MSLRRCIPELQGQNKLSRDQAERAHGLFEELERDYSTKFGKQAADAMASDEAVRRLEAEALNKKRQAALQVTAQQEIAKDVRRFKGDNPGAAAEALLDADDRSPYYNVYYRAKAIANEHFAMMNGILEKFSRNSIGQVRNLGDLREFVRERFGESTGNQSAKELSEAFGETAESLRMLFNMHGGAIAKLEGWGLPQVHNMLAVRAASFDEWRDFIRPLLAPERMKDSSGNPMTPQALEMALRETKETIDSDGWNERRAGAFSGGGKLANRHADSRFLVFKDADSWMQYAERFGRPTSRLAEKIDAGGPIFDAMISHIHGMSRDIALMQRLGPNPAATIRWVKDGLEIEARQSIHPDARRKAAKKSRIRLQNMYDELNGGVEIENEGLARFMQGVRTWEAGSKLGGAVISSTGDVATQIVTRRFNGLPAMRVVGDYAGSLRPSSAADREHAARQLYIADRAIRTMSSYSRWTGETITGEIPARLADAQMQLSYLSKWTDDGHRLYNESTWAAITDNRNLSWDTLQKKGTLLNPTHRFRRMLERYGIGEQEWDTIRSTPLVESHGAKWILPGNMPSHLSQRLAEMVLTESNMAVPTQSLRITSAINARFHKGSVPGEVGRSILQFRGFPLQLFWMHGRRMLQSGRAGGLEYAATLFITSTVMGALAYQLKQVVAGKDPASMDPHENPAFIAKAAFQGGGLGIMGDFINSATSRSGTSSLASQLGPTASTIDDLLAFVAVRRDSSGQLHVGPGKKGAALRRLIQNNTPGSSNWYTRLVFSREVLDRLQAAIDPDYYDSFGRMEKRAREDHTGFYWRPGHSAPDRAPDLANATK